MRYITVIILILSCFTTHLFAQDKLPDAANLPNEVGDIIFNPQKDQYDFKLCDKDNIYQYYGLHTSYKGEAKALRKELFAKMVYQPGFKSITGSVTVRFIVNCQGQTGWFRVYQLDAGYRKVSFPPVFINMVLEVVKSLKRWIPGKLPNGAFCDTYYYLHFNVVNGHIKDIAI